MYTTTYSNGQWHVKQSLPYLGSYFLLSTIRSDLLSWQRLNISGLSLRKMLRNSQSKGRKPGSRNSLKGLEHLAKFLFTKWLSLFSDHTVRVMSERHVIKWVQRMQRMCVCGFNTPCLQMVASTPKTSGSTVKLSGLCSSVFVCVLTRGKCGKLS